VIKAIDEATGNHRGLQATGRINVVDQLFVGLTLLFDVLSWVRLKCLDVFFRLILAKGHWVGDCALVLRHDLMMFDLSWVIC